MNRGIAPAEKSPRKLKPNCMRPNSAPLAGKAAAICKEGALFDVSDLSITKQSCDEISRCSFLRKRLCDAAIRGGLQYWETSFASAWCDLVCL